MKFILILSLLIVIVMSPCPNGCSGHGRCKSGVCECFEQAGIGDGKSYTGNDCSLLKCAEGNPLFASASAYVGSSGSDFGYNHRELSSNNKTRNLSISDSIMTINGGIESDTEGKLWNVSVSDDFLNPFPKMGGYIQCSYAESGNKGVKDEKVEVIGVSENKKIAYLKFDDALTKPTSISCNRIISVRKSMVYYGPKHNIDVPAGRRELGENDKTITWNNYGKIFKELGLLTEEEVKEDDKPEAEVKAAAEGGKTYLNKDFKFMCYTGSNVLTEYTATASYTDTEEDKITFTLSGSTDLDTNSFCYCVMDADAKETIKIENTELKAIVKEENKISRYIFGTGVTEIDENGYAIIALTEAVVVSGDTSPQISIDSGFIVNDRIIYVDILKDGKVSEKEVKVASSPRILRQLATAFTLSSNKDEPPLADGDIILPYIKMHSSNPTIDTKPIIEGDAITGNVYKVYSLADVLISQLDKQLGGKLQCNYKDGKIVVDVKGYEKSSDKTDSHVAYSYVEFPKEITQSSDISSLKCSNIILKRKDFTLYNPLELKSDGKNYNEGVLTWSKYASLLSVYKTSGTTNFACYNPKNNNNFTIYKEVTVANPNTEEGSNDVTFTFKDKTPPQPSVGDICYLLADGSGTAITDLLETDLVPFISYEEGVDGKIEKYYYGNYPKPSKGEILVEQDDNGNPVFILDNSEGSPNKITNDEITINTDILTNYDLEYFEIGKIIYIEVVGDDNIPYNHKAKIISIGKERLLAVSSDKVKTVKYGPSIPSDKKPTGTILSSSPVPPVINIIGVTLDPDKYLYKVSGFLEELLLKLDSKFGGKLQCKYVETKEDKTTTTVSSTGFVDVKGYVMDDENENVEHGYLQFDHAVIKRESKSSPGFYIEDIECNEIISERKDMSLFNPTEVKDGVVTWTGYGLILTDIGFTKKNPYTFACYSSTDTKKLMKIYETQEVTIPQEGGNVEFSFADGQPSNGDMCYLLSDGEGKEIDIGSSDLAEFLSSDDDGNYYYGKYVDVEIGENTKEIIVNNDGSQTIILGKELFTADETENTKDKINVAKLTNPDSPSIGYPPSLISDGIKKLMIPGTTIVFSIGESTQSTQILKVKMNKEMNNKFELSLSKSVGVMRLRSLVTLPSSPIIMTFTSESSTHKPLECSGQGICDRNSGICKCYDGYSGSACQRLDCPNNCNGNGRCVALSELLSNPEIENGYEGFGNKHKSIDDGGINVEFENQIFGCLCDKRHRGYDCSLIECPSGSDPEGVSNTGDLDYRDCSGRGICNYESGICECFEGFIGEGCQKMIETM